jgi:hypothetical protein
MVMKQDKLGTYITKLMTTAIDFKKDDFVRELALDELNRLNVNIQEFIIKNKTEEKVNKTEKQLLQEDKKDG